MPLIIIQLQTIYLQVHLQYLFSRKGLLFLDRIWSWQVLYVLVWFRLVWYGFVRNGIVGPEGSFKVLNSLEWNCMLMECLIWSFMVCMILCGLVRFSVVYYSNVFPCKVSNGLIRLYMVLYGLTQLCTIFVLVFFIQVYDNLNIQGTL